jgi:hypothetical protein
MKKEHACLSTGNTCVDFLWQSDKTVLMIDLFVFNIYSDSISFV